METSVSLVKCIDHYWGIQEVLTPFEEELESLLSETERVVIKINMVVTSTPRRPHGVYIAVTPVDAVRSFIDFILPFYQEEIIIAEESCWGNTKKGFSMYGYDELAAEFKNVELLDIADDEVCHKGIPYSEEELLLPFCKTMIEAPFLISVARPKVHCNTAISAGIKNVAIGAVEGYRNRKKLHTNKDLHEVIAKISKVILPHLVIIDGLEGMEESGPIQGRKVEPGWSLASFDALTADSMTAFLMDFEVSGIPYLCMMHDLGLGKLYPKDEIYVIGEEPDQRITPFKPYRKFAGALKKRNIS